MSAIEGRVSRAIPQALVDSNEEKIRSGRYGELVTVGFPRTKHFLADEGSYFVATNPTIGTGIAGTIAAAYSATASAFFFLRNTESASLASAKRVYFDFAKLFVTVAPASATHWSYAALIDSGASRYTSGGSAITPVNPNGDSAIASIVQMYAGALTTVAAISGRIVARGNFKPLIPIIYDELVLVSGSVEGGGGFVAPSGAAYAGRCVSHCAPIVIGPQQNLVIFMWGTSNAVTAISAEFEAGWWER